MEFKRIFAAHFVSTLVRSEPLIGLYIHDTESTHDKLNFQVLEY